MAEPVDPPAGRPATDDGEGHDPPPQPLGAFVPEGILYDGSAILDRFLSWIAGTGLEPYPAQEDALLELMSGKHVILSTPTGSGKSLVALGLHFKAMCEEARSFYTAPIKALVSEKFFALCDQFGPQNVGMLTGDASINWAAPIICCTAEVLSNMALTQAGKTDAPYVVMDEFHYYSDRERGSAWQIPLILLPKTRFLLMSATLGNTKEIEERIEEQTGKAVARVHSDERPVPLDFSYRETPLHETVESLRDQGKAPIYMVHFTQREAAEQAQALTSAAITSREEKKAIAAAIRDFRFDTPYGKDIHRFLGHGIGLHHAGLLPKYRLLVERLAQQGLLKVICGTDTLGVGVNIPIRSVLFSKLCKFDGEKVTILSVRDFKQISGRAGRKGFDDSGSIVAQAPEYVIENKKIDAKMAGAARGGRKKIVKKKPPTKGFVNWTQATFEGLVSNAPETLSPHFSMNHGLIVSCLQSEAAGRIKGGGYRALAWLVENSHQDSKQKRQLMRTAARLFRSLREADVVEVVRGETTAGRVVEVSMDMQEDFSLHHALSLYLVDAAAALDTQSEDHALDVLSITEAILENPRPILYQQERQLKGELIASLKAQGVPYEERMERLEDITWPKPNEELIYATFNLFREKHPWAGSEDVKPKGVARELYETLSTFHDYVNRMGLARVEGLLLRYLGQVHDTLTRTLPAHVRTDEVEDMIGFFRALVARVDSSLIEAWEDMVAPKPADGSEPQAREYDLAADPRAFRARVRSELQSVVRALASRRYAEAVLALHPSRDDPWDADRLETAMAGFYEEYEAILYDPRARSAHLCVISEKSPRLWEVHQALLDDQGDDLWNLEGEVDLRSEGNPIEPLFRLIRIGC